MLMSYYRSPFELGDNNHRKSVIQQLQEKFYSKDLKLTHTMSKKNDKIYIEGYLGQVTLMRISFKPEEKNKIRQFYYKIRKYIQDAFFRFEQEWATGKIA